MATDWTEIMTGVCERELDTHYRHIRIHYSADAEKDDAWVRRNSARYGGVQSPKWRREFEIDYSAVTGQPVYPMLSDAHLCVKPVEGMTVFRVIDHGIRHPMVCIWVGVNRSGDRHVFREYYRTGATIPVNCSEVLHRSSEPVRDTYIDPATRQRIPLGTRDNQPVSVVSMYNRSLGIPCRFADNSRVGYDAVRNGLLSTLARNALRDGIVDADSQFCKTYFKEYALTAWELEQLASKPALTFDPACMRVFREMRNLRFRDLSGDPASKAQPEEVVDFEDDGPDTVRYAMQSNLKYTSIGRAVKGSPFWQIEQKRKTNPRYVERAS